MRNSFRNDRKGRRLKVILNLKGKHDRDKISRDKTVKENNSIPLNKDNITGEPFINNENTEFKPGASKIDNEERTKPERNRGGMI